jgi:hypothetical protein
VLLTWHRTVTHVATHVSRINCHLCREPTHCQAHQAFRTPRLVRCYMRARTLVLAERRLGVLADLIGYRPLTPSGRVKVDESGHRAVVAHMFHQLAKVRARVCGELVAGMAQIMKVGRGRELR